MNGWWCNGWVTMADDWYCLVGRLDQQWICYWWTNMKRWSRLDASKGAFHNDNKVWFGMMTNQESRCIQPTGNHLGLFWTGCDCTPDSLVWDWERTRSSLTGDANALEFTSSSEAESPPSGKNTHKELYARDAFCSWLNIPSWCQECQTIWLWVHLVPLVFPQKWPE